MVNGPEDVILDWEAIDWRYHEDNVRLLRQRIFAATRQGDLATVRNLQKVMLRSWSNTLISVRQATQRNAWPQDGGDRRTGRVDLHGPDGPGGAGARSARYLATPRGQAGVHTQGRHPCQAAPARDSRA